MSIGLRSPVVTAHGSYDLVGNSLTCPSGRSRAASWAGEGIPLVEVGVLTRSCMVERLGLAGDGCGCIQTNRGQSA